MRMTFCFLTLLRTIAWHTTSQTAPRDFSKDIREELDYEFLLKKKKSVVEHQNITANHTQKTDLKLMILELFYVWEYSGVWAH